VRRATYDVPAWLVRRDSPGRRAFGSGKPKGRRAKRVGVGPLRNQKMPIDYHHMSAKPASESATEMVQVVLPNDANPLGFILGGTVMHLIDMAAAVAAHRHTRSLLVTAAVDGLQFLHPIKVGDLIILRARVTAVWTTSLEVEVEVFSEEILTGLKRLTSRAYLTFVAVDRERQRLPIPTLILESDGDRRRAAEAEIRRAARLEARKAIEARPPNERTER
jgi:acyl-CoA hydrolase